VELPAQRWHGHGRSTTLNAPLYDVANDAIANDEQQQQQQQSMAQQPMLQPPQGQQMSMQVM
jgi:hypothetical protein